jgi:hypothetical protein
MVAGQGRRYPWVVLLHRREWCHMRLARLCFFFVRRRHPWPIIPPLP